jgi:hypothetical protein
MESNNTPFLSYQQSEVSKMEWKTYEQCMLSIRDYNLEKKDTLTRVDKLLNNYKLYNIM